MSSNLVKTSIIKFNEDEKVELRIYKDCNKLFLFDMVSSFNEIMLGKKREVMYAGYLKNFEKLDYKGKTLDEKIISDDNQKLFKSVSLLGGNMDSYIFVLRYPLKEEKKEIKPSEAKKLVKNKEAEFMNYQGVFKFLDYQGELYYQDKRGFWITG